VEDFRSGNGAAWLDFMATLIGRYRDTQADQLSDSRTLREWLVLHELGPAESPGDRDLANARELREALHAVTVAAVSGEPAPLASVRVVEAALQADRPLTLRRTADGLKAARPANTAEALARLAREAVHDLIGPARESLHACGDETCSGVFMDRVGKRRWCSDERCGNRARVRAHRARARGESAG
jgi:predicted RNA-binding Zn ribbon-like protein